MTSQNVEVKLELGHRATLRNKKTPEGFTHDWTLFVRGPEGLNIHNFVEKVVFFLHESFPKPKRVLKEPPYHVTEAGYAGFNLAIEVHFRNKEDPKKVRFEYDLYLHLEGPPIHNSRLEKLTFQNPNQEFRKKLLKGGGVAVSGGSQSNNFSSSNPVQTETEEPPRPKPIKGSNEVPKKTPKTKLPHIVKEVPPKVPEPTRHPFTDIFGAPIKTKPSPDISLKSKDNAKEKPSSKSTSSSTPTPTSSSKTSSKDKTSSSTKEKHSKSVNKEADKKENKSSSLKRSLSPATIPPSQPSSQPSHKVDDTIIKKRRRSTSTSSTTSSVTDKNSATSKDTKKKPKEKEHKKEHKTVPPVVPPSVKEAPKQRKPQQVAPRKEPRDSKSPVSAVPNEDQESVTSSGRPRIDSESSEASVRSHEEKEVVKQQEDESRSSIGSASSPSSSLSLSSLPPGSTHGGPLATMIAQMEQELVSPMSSEQATPIRSPITPEEPVKEEVPPDSPTPASPMPVKKGKDKRRNDRTLPATKKVKESENNLPPPPPPHVKSNGKQQQPIDAAYLRELMQLQERIMALRDKQHLQRIVDVIEETGLYQITSSTIDFDLCALDRSTVQKLQNCMAVT